MPSSWSRVHVSGGMPFLISVIFTWKNGTSIFYLDLKLFNQNLQEVLHSFSV
jgi:hypothetical protein